MFEGTLTAMITPFDENGEIDEDGLRKNVEFQIKNGINGLVPVGTTGECSTLSYDEHVRVIEIVVNATKGRVPVLAGTGSNSTWEAIMLTRRAKEVGADGALVVVPYYNKPTQAGLYAHYKKIAEEVDIPIVIYNIPSRTGVNIQPETVAKLARLKNIVGIKEASGDMQQVKRIIELVEREDFILTSGNDSDTLEIMRLGGVGVISVASNIIPREIVELVESARRGDWKKAEEIHRKFLPLFKGLFIETNPVPIKTAMRWLGMPAGGVRLPLVEMEPENQNRLKQILIEAGIFGRENP